MFEALLKFLPEWVLPVIFGLLVWFGANYLLIAPEIANRTVANTCDAADMAYCNCVAGHMISDARFELALWTSSLTLYRVDRSATVIAARKNGVEQCQSL